MKAVSAFLASLFFSGFASAASVEEDVARYVAIFNGDVEAHTEAAESLGWTGLSDPKIFDIVEQRLLADYQEALDYPSRKLRAINYIRALGYSGQEKYEPTLRKFTKMELFSRYANQSLAIRPGYQRWNPVISNRASFDPKYSDDINRAVNMLRSDELELKGLAGKRICASLNQEQYLLDMLAPQVEANYMIAPTAKPENRQAVASMVRGLGCSKQEKYHALLLEIRKSALDHYIVNHAKRALLRDFD